MSYSAIVFKIKTEPHPNPEVHSLRVAKAFGYELVIGRDNLGHFPQDGDLFVFFPTEGQLSEAMCEANDLYPRYDDNGLRIGGGFFDPKNRRVRAQKFKGVKSEGFALPIERLSFTGFNINKLKEGDEFTELNGIHLCNKYQTQAERRALAKLANKSKQGKKNYTNELFKKHVDTLHWKKIKASMLPERFVYVVTEKLHGCVSEDTLVETLEFGTVTIGSLVKNQPSILHIKSFNTETNRIEFAEVSDYYFLENDGDWYEIELEDGTKLEITGNNPVWLPKEQKYVKVEELKGDETLLIS